MGNSLSKKTCENCGAPLSRARQRGKYICQYCDAVYYDDFYADTAWEEEQEETPISESVAQDWKGNGTTPYSSPNKKRFLWIWLVLGVLLVGCSLIFILGGLFGLADSSVAGPMKSTGRPSMLASLPAAEEAGKAVAYADWEITLDPEISVNDGRIFLKWTLQNWHNSEQIFRYAPANIIVYDDLGNDYPVYLGYCAADLPYLDRQVSFSANEKIRFKSAASWCNSETDTPAYSGVVPINAQHLYVHLKQFGVFKNITFVFDL